MKIVTNNISLDELKKLALSRFGNLVKAVVDIDKKIMALDAELHADEEALLLADGSKQENLWGINIYPEMSPADRIEFDSMINIKPHQANRSRYVEDQTIREKIIRIVDKLITS